MKTLTLQRKIVVVLIFLLPCFSMLGQDCKGLLLDYINRMSSVGSPDNKKIFYLHFSIKYALWDLKKGRVPDVDAKIYLGRKI